MPLQSSLMLACAVYWRSNAGRAATWVAQPQSCGGAFRRRPGFPIALLHRGRKIAPEPMSRNFALQSTVSLPASRHFRLQFYYRQLGQAGRRGIRHLACVCCTSGSCLLF